MAISDIEKDPRVNESVADFDRFARIYRDEITSALGVFGQSVSFFAEYKVKLCRKRMQREPQSILDFGCGIGESIPHFRHWFPQSEISGFDVSRESLDELETRYPDVQTFGPHASIRGRFDLIFVSNVLHHIAPGERYERLISLWKHVSLGGSLCIFEHNPLNPITRRIVSNCALDEGVELLSYREVKSLVRVCFGPQRRQGGYCLFFPPLLRQLSFLESSLTHIPMGGQHFTIVTKTT